MMLIGELQVHGGPGLRPLDIRSPRTRAAQKNEESQGGDPVD